MNETAPLFEHLTYIVGDVHFWGLVFAYWIFSAAVGALPAPTAESSLFYRWLFQFLNTLAGNITRAFSAKIPGLKPNGGVNQ